ncbi:MAG: hypothetical protein QM683_02455 [Lacrimispora sp.]
MKIGIESNILKSIFRNVYFITGTAYAGKSTMVKVLSEKFNGICCGENYHDKLMTATSPEKQPDLCYFQTMKSWQEFLNRSPKEYDTWFTGCCKEAAELEIIHLIRLSNSENKIFVDTNIPLDILKEISDYHHVAIMLSEQHVSAEKFFDRGDEEKQFLLRQIQLSEDPENTLNNFKRCIEEVNSQTHYNDFLNSGFFIHLRDEQLTISETAGILAKHFGLL